MYTVAVTRIQTDASGAYTENGLVSGTVTLNVVDGRLNSVTVKRPGITRTRLTARQVIDLSFPSKRDLLTLAALTR
jgi:hemolysin activation/secretion protein